MEDPDRIDASEPLASRSAPSFEVVCAAARATLYGNGRNPNDVDILVWRSPALPPIDREHLKSSIVKASPTSSFYLLPSKRKGETYQVVWFRHRELQEDCKVDILVPGILHLPERLPAPYIKTVHDIPVAPIALVLLQKLQAWHDHGVSPEYGGSFVQKLFCARAMQSARATLINGTSHLK
ncbi:hypothetical protein PLICRDRAFT_170862 [Plicaturopsis crispa FD-325 SS-3]|nr:hypothetical protein PLICRDRAFT_170862 [Plicaturopsis crispa FD-325 SS-3]